MSGPDLPPDPAGRPEPISAVRATAARLRLSDVRGDGPDVLWAESGPADHGRVRVVRRCGDSTREALPPWADPRSRVHEYGGGAWWARNGAVWFTHCNDQRLYCQPPSGARPVALTTVPDGVEVRFADGDVDAAGAALVCVRETHRPGAVDNEIVRMPATTPAPTEVVVSGPDFVTHPRLRPDGGALCWVQWNHPAMPWQESTLMVRDLDTGREWAVAGGPGESVSAPVWQPDGSLWFLSDRSGWSNLYRWSDGVVSTEVSLNVDIGEPDWYLGASRYAVFADGSVAFAQRSRGRDRLCRRTPDGRLLAQAAWLTAVSTVRAGTDGSALVIGSAPDRGAGVYRVRSDGGVEVLRESEPVPLPSHRISRPTALLVPGEGSRPEVPVLFHPPTAGHAGLGPPPLILDVHGGPTSAAHPGLRLSTQFWTTRGFAVADVDYRGSSGYGRWFREQLNGQWGVADVDDCLRTAEYLAERRLVDRRLRFIRGSSAGGFTALLAVARPGTPFLACVNHFGITDLRRLVAHTHKFERYYLHSLLGPPDEAGARYTARSPVSQADRIDRPVLIIQGAEDPVVPPEQSAAMAASLRSRGVAVEYLLFEGESHGFRRSENLIRTLEAEYDFYRRVISAERRGRRDPSATATPPG